MNNTVYTGIANDDRRIAAELQAMGAFDQAQADEKSAFLKAIEAAGDFITWMRWKGEVGVYGCRIGAEYARRQEALAIAA